MNYRDMIDGETGVLPAPPLRDEILAKIAEVESLAVSLGYSFAGRAPEEYVLETERALLEIARWRARHGENTGLDP